MMASLPSGYQELTYIESTGTQWIDTGIKVGYPVVEESLDVSLVFQIQEIKSGEIGFFGGKGISNQAPTIFASSGDRKLSTWCGSGSGFSISVVTQVGQRYSVRAVYYATSGRLLSVNGVDYIGSQTNVRLNNSSAGNYTLFADGSVPASYSIIRLYGARIVLDGILVRDFIPCRRLSDGAIGMYDLVSQSFFGNSGTGEFIAGAPVVEPTWGSGLSQVSRKMLMRRDHLVADANAMYFGKSVQNGTPSIRNRVDIVDSAVKKVGSNLYPYVGTLPAPLRAVRLGASVPSAYESVGGIYFDGTDYWCADTYEPSKGRYIQRIREVVMTGTAPYNVNSLYNQLTKTFLAYNSYSALTSEYSDLSAGSYGPLCNYAVTDGGSIFYEDYEHIGKHGVSRITFCVRYPFDYWGIASGEKTDDELIALVNALLKERYEAGVPYILRYVLRNPIVSFLYL